jgi:DNA-binding CsgD family transcriptional regulator
VRDSSHAYALMSRLGLPTAFGKYGSQISLIGRYIGFDASGFRALMSDRPAIATIDVFVYSVFPSLIEVLLHAETGDLDTARSVYGSVGPVSGWRFPPSLRNYAWGLGILAAAYVGELDDVAEFHRRLLPFAEREIVNSSGQSGSLGPAQLCLGYAAQALDRQDEAIERFGAAVELCLARGAVPAGVECRIALAEALAARRAPGDAAKATATLELAEPIARRLTMAPMHARIARLRSHLGSSSGDRDTATATEASPPLSAREAEVAALCADGLTNKQIATRLFISERTAQNHVQHILRRLGFTSRSQIAVWHAIDVSGRDE